MNVVSTCRKQAKRAFSAMFERTDTIILRNVFSFYFLLPISRESIVFGSNFRNGDFDGFTRFEVP